MKESAVMQQDREDMIRRARRMTPQERLGAFFRHSRLITELYLAGVRYRAGRGSRSRKSRAKRR
jgi:hypothetical protein